MIATSALKASASFSRLWPGAMIGVGYATAFYLLSLALKHIPIGPAYAVWSGAGSVLITVIGVLAFRQKIDLAGVWGITSILAGVLVLNLLSKNGVHLPHTITEGEFRHA